MNNFIYDIPVTVYFGENQLQHLSEELAKFGIKTHMEENSIEIGSGLKAPGEAICGHNDHRIVMSLSLLLSLTGGTITEAEAVRKSYPGFFDDIQKLGIVVN